MKAARILAANVAALLTAQHKTQTALGLWCRHSKTWVSQFLNGHRNWQLDDLDRVADFFGKEPHELFQPSMDFANRRTMTRRAGKDRRTAHEDQMGKILAGARFKKHKKEDV